MTNSAPAIAGTAALGVLLFWLVGAYHRLTRLRAEMVRRFAPVEVQLRTRQQLLYRQIEALAPVLVSAGPRLEALRAACRQTDAAMVQAQLGPGRREPLTSLRVAEDILCEARGRLPVQGASGPVLGELQGELSQVDAALAYARGQFNAAAQAYNAALRQFPTLLVAGLLGMRPAGAL